MSSLKDLFQLINFKKKLEHHPGTVNKLIDPSIHQKELLFYKKGKTTRHCVSLDIVTLEIVPTKEMNLNMTNLETTK